MKIPGYGEIHRMHSPQERWPKGVVDRGFHHYLDVRFFRCRLEELSGGGRLCGHEQFFYIHSSKSGI
jgi:hypothetical protein